MVVASKTPRILCRVLLAAASAHGLAHQAKDDARLPVVGAAPVFALTDLGHRTPPSRESE